MPQHQPVILTDASIQISKTIDDTGLTELACDASHVEVAPDTAVTTVDTFCGSADYPGTTKWSLIATLVQSFDTDATEEVLSAALAASEAAGGASVPFRVAAYKSIPIGPTNPAWEGLVRPAPYSPLNGDAGEASTVELEWAITEGPTKIVVPPAGATAAAEGERETPKRKAA